MCQANILRPSDTAMHMSCNACLVTDINTGQGGVVKSILCDTALSVIFHE
jgi:hypothetical protein